MRQCESLFCRYSRINFIISYFIKKFFCIYFFIVYFLTKFILCCFSLQGVWKLVLLNFIIIFKNIEQRLYIK
ncbi:hypothetical protein C2G38_682076 [Gigaspora rosea]|uniref:Uncharacterized protein n=1 Tax=Gigaspora rosea TaxID=44941 RepID=A0A397U454_9GLOM|nr:hypothetical protein C2G38_682076 [Gigaspora rosea]